ncbi:restriction endonuclease subunit S [Basfia succiniciproducens]|uniref:restriction endonuclease subunit S n=1 Tax=Basfia succiniciproducens TaxID=653940 RepID=UPI003FCEBD8C
MEKLKTIKFSEFGKIVTGKTPSSSCPNDFGTEIPFITPTDDFDNKFIIHPLRFLSIEGKEKLYGKLLPKNSVMVTCIGSAMGKVAMTNSDTITNQQINSIVVGKEFNPDYIFYVLKNNYKLLRSAASGSTALPLLNKTDFENLECKIFPQLQTQQKIAHTLSILDRKIALNQ